MTGKEAKEIFDMLTEIADILLTDHHGKAFYRLGRLSEKMAQIIAIDQDSFNAIEKKTERNHPWVKFNNCRLEVIEWLKEAKYNSIQIAKEISVDEEEVDRLIREMKKEDIL